MRWILDSLYFVKNEVEQTTEKTTERTTEKTTEKTSGRMIETTVKHLNMLDE